MSLVFGPAEDRLVMKPRSLQAASILLGGLSLTIVGAGAVGISALPVSYTHLTLPTIYPV